MTADTDDVDELRYGINNILEGFMLASLGMATPKHNGQTMGYVEEIMQLVIPLIHDREVRAANKAVYDAMWRLRSKQGEAAKFGEMQVIGVGHIIQELSALHTPTDGKEK